MGGLAVTFIIIPCITACTAAWFLTDWRLAGAVAAGCLGLLFLPSLTLMLPAATFLLPAFIGTAIGACVSGYSTFRSPDTTPWSRMTYALIFTFALAVFALLSMS